MGGGTGVQTDTRVHVVDRGVGRSEVEQERDGKHTVGHEWRKNDVQQTGSPPLGHVLQSLKCVWFLSTAKQHEPHHDGKEFHPYSGQAMVSPRTWQGCNDIPARTMAQCWKQMALLPAIPGRAGTAGKRFSCMDLDKEQLETADIHRTRVLL